MSVAKLGQTMSRLSERFVPDPFVLVLLLSALVAALSLSVGQSFEGMALDQRAAKLLQGWYGELYGVGLMKFAMQMCIVLITGHALALSGPVQRAIGALTGLAKTPGAAVVIVALTSCFASLIQWGMGVIVGAFMAREMGRALAQRDIKAHYPLLGAAGYAGFLTWHGGLSGSAPLAVAGQGHFLADKLGVIPVSQTLLSPLNLVTTLSLLISIPLSLWLLSPKDPAQLRPYPLGADTPSAKSADEAAPHRPGLFGALEERRWLTRLSALCLLAMSAYNFHLKGVDAWNLDTINLLFLALGMAAHESPRSYVAAITDGARGCAGIILQFPFYFGILGMLKASGLIAQLAQAFVSISSPTTFPLWTFISAGLINMLVPSGGGQWAVQGPVMAEAVSKLGVDPARCIMALSYGDAWTNMLQPFWALPLLGIMNLRASDLIGYTTTVMLITGPIIALWLLVL